AEAGIHGFVSRASEARPGTSRPDLWPWVPATHSASQTRVNVLLLSRGPRCGDERSGEAHRANWDPSTGVLLDTGNSLCYRTQPLRGLRRRHSGRIAQLVEQLTLNQRVPGSSPGAPTKNPNNQQDLWDPARLQGPPMRVRVRVASAT